MYSRAMIRCNLGKSVKITCLILGLFLLAQAAFSQESSSTELVPNVLRTPERGEAPRYPNDLVIGELGRADAPEGAYLLAQSIVSAITDGRRNAQALTESGYSIAESVFEEIRGIRPRYYRLGGGRIEPDGCVSFLVRISGSQESITGELFLRRAEADEIGGSETLSEPEGRSSQSAGRWLLDDIIFEDKRTLTDIRDSYRYDFSPYERFY